MHCLDKAVVEGKLVEIIQRQIASFAMQDLRCQRCNQVRSSNMLLLCDCSGGYKLESAATDYWKKIRTIKDLAEYYQFDMALEMANDCLRCA